MISSSSSSHRSTVPQGTVTYPVTAGSASAGSRTSSAGNAKCGRLPVRDHGRTRARGELRQAAGAVHEPDALAVYHGLLAVDPPHPPRVHLDERDVRRWVEVESARRTLAERATTHGQGHARTIDRRAASGPAGLVELRVDRTRRPGRKARHARALLL